MCGIAGIVAPQQSSKALGGSLSAMLDALHHRGPDGRGRFVDRGIALGHTRLAIIDLEPTGQQPMTNEYGTLQLVINGEIYNYRDVRQDLQARGHRFQSQSDSEVVLHLYEEYGDDCVHHLEGMFAFALWDASRQRLLLARDRFGMKPLFFAQHGDVLSFASELTPLLFGNEFEYEINPEALYAYLTFSYIPGHLSVFKGVEKVRPAERVIWENGVLTRDTYWKPNPTTLKINRHEAMETLSEHLQRTVSSHLVADVPVSAFLSGGVDSSAIVAMARRHCSIQTFCMSFSGTEEDEGPLAKVISQHLSTEHHEVHINLDPLDLLLTALDFMDEPFADSSALPTFAVSQAARQVAKVVLSGDGGDEVFGGYTGRYRVAALQAVVPRPDLLARGIRTLPPWHSGRRRSLPDMLDLASLSDTERFVQERQISSLEQRVSLFGHKAVEEYEPRLHEIPLMAIQHAAHWHPVQRALWIDMATALPDDMLTKVDRMSMAHGLEVRVPFLDHQLVEFALSLPASWLVSPWPVEGKRILRKFVKPLMPPGIHDGPKRGFVIPLQNWMKDSFIPLFEGNGLTQHSELAKWMDLQALTTLWQTRNHKASMTLIYAVMVLELWLRRMRTGRV